MFCDTDINVFVEVVDTKLLANLILRLEKCWKSKILLLVFVDFCLNEISDIIQGSTLVKGGEDTIPRKIRLPECYGFPGIFSSVILQLSFTNNFCMLP